MRDEERQMNHDEPVPYQDSGIRCDDDSLTIHRYYPWGAKRIRYLSIRDVTELPLSGASKVRRWRIWGSGDFLHWWNFDPHRPRKTLALVLNVGHRIRPTITPDDPKEVERILKERISEGPTR
jgi:hypothetical protein